jgi:opacity protein-like surface antigen
VRNRMLVAVSFGLLLAFASAAMAQERMWSEVSVQGTGSFTKDSVGNGITQHTTDTGGLLLGYRFHFNRWLAVDASYGYNRNTLQNFTDNGPFHVQSNVHQATGALVVTLPWRTSKLVPYTLAGAGALIFDPTGNTGGFVPGAQKQTKATFVYGGGVDYDATSHVSLRLEYRGLVYQQPDFELNSLHSDATAHTAQPSAGFVVRF